MSAFLAFSNKRRAATRQANKELSSTAISKLLAKEWHDSSDEFKRPYLEENARQNAKYNEAMKPFRTKNTRRKEGSSNFAYYPGPAVHSTSFIPIKQHVDKETETISYVGGGLGSDSIFQKSSDSSKALAEHLPSIKHYWESQFPPSLFDPTPLPPNHGFVSEALHTPMKNIPTPASFAELSRSQILVANCTIPTPVLEVSSHDDDDDVSLLSFAESVKLFK